MRIIEMYHRIPENFFAMFRIALAGGLMCGSVLHGAGLGYLAGSADAVVVGSVANRIEGATQVSFTIAVDRVLSGSLPSQTPNLAVVHAWAGALHGPGQTIVETLYGIWFVRQTAPGVWDVLTARPSVGVRTILGLFLPAATAVPSSGPYSYGPGTPALDALAYEVAAGIQSAAADPELLRDAYSGTTTPVVLSVLAGYLASANPSFQAVGIAGTLERQVPGAIQQFAGLWPAIGDDSHAADVLSAIRDAWRDPTPSGVLQLATIASARPPGDALRANATRALAAIHTQETLPFLAGLLSSTDSDEQVQSVYGLSSFANGCPIQTQGNTASLAYLMCDGPSAYKTPETVANFGFRPGPPDQEQALLSFWQAWWSAHPELH